MYQQHFPRTVGSVIEGTSTSASSSVGVRDERRGLEPLGIAARECTFYGQASCYPLASSPNYNAATSPTYRTTCSRRFGA
jgi:hypothetical protein